MKKTLAVLVGSLSTLAFAPQAFAQRIDPCAKGGFRALCNLKTDDIGQIVQTAITILLIIAVLVALFFLVWGGIKWITSGGDKAKVESARNTIVASIIGLVIAFLAYFILQVIMGIFGLSFSDIVLPKLT